MAETLQDVVREVRQWTRLGQRDFAAAATVAKNTIGRIETGQAKTAEPATLRLIAEAAIREATGQEAARHDAEAVYRRLLIAGGHLTEQAATPPEPAPVDRLSREIRETFNDDAQMIEDFFIQARDFDDEDRRFVLSTIRWLNHQIPVATARRKTRTLLASR